MRIVGPVHIDSLGLAARCMQCWKSLVYRTGMHQDMWNRMLKAFIKKHKNCKGETV